VRIPTAKQRRLSTDQALILRSRLLAPRQLTLMPGVPLSDDLKDRIVKWYYEDQETMKEIAVQARCSIGTVSNVLCLYREYGKFKDPFRQRTGRPSKLSKADLKFLDAIVVANPSLYLDEIQQKLKDVREVEVSIATLARALASLELTRKQITKAASERDGDAGKSKADPDQDTNIEVKNEICGSHLGYLKHSDLFMYNTTSYRPKFLR
jgi:transposase